MMKNLSNLILLLPSLLLWQGVSGQYCAGGPGYTGDSNIETLDITGENATSISYIGCPGILGIEDQTVQSVDITAGSIYSLDIQFGYCGSFPYGGSGEAWIDFNQNQVFEASESIVTSSGNPSNAPWNAVVSLSFTVPPNALGGITRMRVIQEESGTNPLDPCATFNWGSATDFSVDITVLPTTCPFPSNLAISSITSTGATLDWTENGTATSWNVEWGAAGFVPGTGNEFVADMGNITQTSIATGLTSSPLYDVYVQADCGGGDLSFWSGPFSFSNTYCIPSYTFTNEYLSLIETVGAIADVSYTASSYPAAGYADETVQIVQGYETMSFDLNTTYTPAFGYQVNTWIDWNSNFVFDAGELMGTASGTPSTNQQIVIPVGTPVGDYRMRVRGAYGPTSNPPACGSANWGSAVDFTMTVIAAPSCLPPFDLDSVIVTTTSVDLSWLELNSATTWNIEYGPTGFIQGSTAGIPLVVTTNPYLISGLNPSTQYDFYVQSDCGGGDISAWRGPYSTYTDCGLAVAPYYEGFNNGVIPQCWENLASGNPSANNLWLFTGAPGYGATNNGKPAGSYAWADGSGINPDSLMLVTPEIDISQLTSPFLSFEWFSNNTFFPLDNNPLIIEVFDGTSWNYLDTLLADNVDWMFVNYDLSAFLGNNIKVRFMLNQNTTTNAAFYNDILLDEVRIADCISLGGQDGSLDICRLDSTVNLNNNIIVKPNGGGEWSFPAQPGFLDDSIFTVNLLPAGSYEVYYTERFVCYDTTFATINVFNLSAAGMDGADTVCKNQPIDLFGALGGSVDLGGQWFDFSNTLLLNSQPKAEPIPGQYNYFYVANNGVCPADSAIVNIKVEDSCNFLSLGEELFTDISVYPNPTTNLLNIVNPSNTSSLKVEMLDMNGRVVLVENKALNNASEATLTIDYLEKGIYTLRIYNNEGQKTFKIVKQ